MAKTPRPSIADQLAGIAATRPRDDATTLPRHHVAVPEEPDAAPPPAAAPAPESAPRDHVTTSSRRSVSTRRRENETPDGMKVRQRVERPHASLYAHPRVFKKLREIAAAEDCKPHDLYVEGLRMVLERYGYDLDKIERGEA